MRDARLLAALMVGGGVIGWLISGSAAYSRLAYAGLLLALGMWLWTGLVLRALRVDRQADSLRASVGDIFKEHYDVFNDGRLPVPWVEIVNDSGSTHSTPGVCSSMEGIMQDPVPAVHYGGSVRVVAPRYASPRGERR